MAFQANQQQISFLLGKKIYSIPRNQRRYVWNIENWKNLLEDLDFLQKKRKNHCDCSYSGRNRKRDS